MENHHIETSYSPFLPPPPSGPSPRVLTIKQFHAAIDGAIGLNSLYELARCGRLKTVRIGRKLLVLASEVDNFFLREAEVN